MDDPLYILAWYHIWYCRSLFGTCHHSRQFTRISIDISSYFHFINEGFSSYTTRWSLFFRHLSKVFLEWRSPTDPPTLLLPGQTLLKIVVKIKMLLLPGMWLKMTNLTQMWQWLWKWEFQECNLTVLNPTHICGCARTWRRPHAAWYGQILTTIFQFSDVIWLISDICNMFHTWRIAAIRALYPLRPCDPRRWTVTPSPK